MPPEETPWLKTPARALRRADRCRQRLVAHRRWPVRGDRALRRAERAAHLRRFLQLAAEILDRGAAEHAIDPYQQFAYTSGKNASDIALVIDAMDLLHSGRFDGFCLVSSDSDFTRLASRLREEGTDVYGFGAQKTPESFRQACRRFIYTENLVPIRRRARAGGRSPRTAAAQCRGALAGRAIEQMETEDGWVGSGASASGSPPSPRTSIRAPTAIASCQTLCATPARSKSTSPAPLPAHPSQAGAARRLVAPQPREQWGKKGLCADRPRPISEGRRGERFGACPFAPTTR